MNIVRRMKSTGGSLVLLACIASAPIQAADYYKWTGEDGVIHYGATPPKGVNAELVKTYGGGASSSSQPQESSTNSSTTSSTASTSAAPAQLTPEQLDAKQKRCTEEKERLAVLSKPGRIRMTLADGSTKYLSEEDIAREIDITKKVIADTCE